MVFPFLDRKVHRRQSTSTPPVAKQITPSPLELKKRVSSTAIAKITFATTLCKDDVQRAFKHFDVDDDQMLSPPDIVRLCAVLKLQVPPADRLGAMLSKTSGQGVRIDEVMRWAEESGFLLQVTSPFPLSSILSALISSLFDLITMFIPH
eukprot:c21475_g1_i1.p1 GENE.c21475_g1_i1~~c21475_g1_i1.p1  ORF type:complete len:150 (+),score=31.97 c21475_g1_i1:195-644(+)